MKLPRRKFLQFAGTAVAAPTISTVATAQDYPSRPITMIVPFPAGGGTDVNGRVVADRMSGSLGRPIIIENISGADGSIGTGRAARARPDGYTIVVGQTSTLVLNGAMYSLQYDVLNDFAPISPLVTSPNHATSTSLSGGSARVETRPRRVAASQVSASSSRGA